jgi:hypothetical protein
LRGWSPMVGIEKDYYALEEVEERWAVPRRDLAYLAENGLLKVSVRLYGVRVELGSYEHTDDGQCFSIPEKHVWFQGLQDLRPHDVYKLFHEGEVLVQHFDAPPEQYCDVLHPEDGIVIKKEELVIRREERDRAESKHGLGGTPRSTESVFSHRNDFSDVTLGDRTYTLGTIQAKVVRILHDAATTVAPWRHGKLVLAEAGSSCTRMADLFKTQPEWRKLIQSDRRGKYRINIKFS